MKTLHYLRGKIHMVKNTETDEAKLELTESQCLDVDVSVSASTHKTSFYKNYTDMVQKRKSCETPHVCTLQNVF